MAMKNWLDAYPQVKVVHSALKFPKTRNGMAILENPDYKARIELVTGPDFPSLKQYEDVQGCAKQNESRIDGVHEKLYAIMFLRSS